MITAKDAREIYDVATANNKTINYNSYLEKMEVLITTAAKNGKNYACIGIRIQDAYIETPLLAELDSLGYSVSYFSAEEGDGRQAFIQVEW